MTPPAEDQMRSAHLLSLGLFALTSCAPARGEDLAAGAPCPEIDARGALERKAGMRAADSINGYVLKRQRGASRCHAAGDGLECELEDPGVVQLVNRSWWDVPEGRDATVTVRGGQGRCVVN